MAQARTGGQEPQTRGERRRNRRGEGARLRADLIEAAARLLESSGDAEGLTLRAVAREVGIAAPSIYRHFSDKNELVEAVVADRFEQLDDALVRAMAAAGDPAEALQACCGAYCRFGLEHPGHYQVLFSATLRLDPFARPAERPGSRVFGRLDDLFQGGAESPAPEAVRCGGWRGRPVSALQTQRRALEARWTPPWTPSPPHCTSPPTTC
jgi:AcrR family transcriptional regulator